MANKQMLNLKFKGGDVTKAIDFPKTFGKFFYLGFEEVFYYDEEKQEMTDEVVGYDMVILSEKTKKPYKVKLSLEADFSSLNNRDEVTLIEPTVRFYHDGGSLTQGATISISCVQVETAKSTGQHSSTKKADNKSGQGKSADS